jgi:hypothetical protein
MTSKSPLQVEQGVLAMSKGQLIYLSCPALDRTSHAKTL